MIGMNKIQLHRNFYQIREDNQDLVDEKNDDLFHQIEEEEEIQEEKLLILQNLL